MILAYKKGGEKKGNGGKEDTFILLISLTYLIMDCRGLSDPIDWISSEYLVEI